MLHYYGDITALALGELAKDYLLFYAKEGSEFAYVPYRDLRLKKKRYVKFMWMEGVGQFVFVDLVDAAN